MAELAVNKLRVDVSYQAVVNWLLCDMKDLLVVPWTRKVVHHINIR
jgi:hypothetical protein